MPPLNKRILFFVTAHVPFPLWSVWSEKSERLKSLSWFSWLEQVLHLDTEV